MAKRIIITLYKTELLYDVQNKTYLAARSRDIAEDPAKAANMTVNGAEPESNQIMRSLGNAFSVLLTKLSPYFLPVAVDKDKAACAYSLKARLDSDGRPDDVYIADNQLMSQDNNKEFTIPLKMPDNFNEAFIGAITAGLHAYLVSIVVAEWFTLYNPQQAEFYYAQADQKLEEARAYLHARVWPIKRPGSVF